MGSDLPARNRSRLDALIKPARVAVIGASPKPNHFANQPLVNLRHYGFTGNVYPVNPSYQEVAGMRCYPSIGDVPSAPDLAVVVLRPQLAVEAVAACAAVGVPAAVVVASGFAETGDEQSAALQNELREAAGDGLRLCGPNTLGVANFNDRVVSFVSGNLPSEPITGSIAVVSQSGGCGFTLVNRAWSLGIGVGHLAVAGNEADITIPELVAYYLDRDDVATVLCYMEAVRDASGLRQVGAMSAATGKPVFVMKTGSSPQGERAAAAHTGALATSDAVCDAALRQWGLGRASSFDALVGAGALASQFRAPDRGAVGVYTEGGGLAVVAADLLAEAGILLPPISPATAARIKALMPDTTPGNPFDSGGQFLSSGVDLLIEGLSAFADDPNLDVIVHCAMPVLGHRQKLYSEGIARVAASSPKPNVVLHYSAGSLTEDAVTIFDEARLLVLDRPEAGAEALGLWLSQARNRPTGPEGASGPSAAATESRRLLSRWAAATSDANGPRTIGEHEAAELLGFYGIPVAKQVLIGDPTEADAATVALRPPYAVKVAGNIAHRSDFGGVIVGVADTAGVADAAAEVVTRARAAHPGTPIDGIIVAEMAPEGTELIAGIQVDPAFGPVVMVGFGGVWAEVLADTALRIPPVDHEAALAMLRSLRGAPMIFGGRGQPPLDTRAIGAVIVGLSRLALDAGDRLQAVDVNPIVAGPSGVVAVDALVELRR